MTLVLIFHIYSYQDFMFVLFEMWQTYINQLFIFIWSVDINTFYVLYSSSHS